MNDMPKNLTVEQKNILSSMKVGAAFAADVAHACITMYVWDDNPKFCIFIIRNCQERNFLVNCLIKQVANCAVMRSL